jgi:hypothetical protein
MLGYDYGIIYKKGKENVGAKALSRKYDEEGSIFSLSFLVPNWLQVVCQEELADAKFMDMVHQ